MESLNMNTLANSLPTSNLANAEADLMNNFKAAAMSITTLYRSSLNTSKRAYNAGYASACQDLLVVIQQGVSVGGASNEGEGGMTIGRVMDWVEARLEAIKTREEEEDEEERESKSKTSSRTPGPSTVNVPASEKENAGDSATQRHATPPTPRGPATPLPPPHPHIHASPLPPPPAATRTLLRAKQRSLRDKDAAHAPAAFAPDAAPPLFAHLLPRAPSPPSPPLPSQPSAPAAAVGAKRRHAVMLEAALDAPPNAHAHAHAHAHALSANTNANVNGTAAASTAAGPGVARRRSKIARGAGAGGAGAPFVAARAENAAPGHHAVQTQHDAMDVEDEGGRERKRVSRR